MEMNIQTNAPQQVVDITKQVEDLVHDGPKAVIIHTIHTSCGITTAKVDPNKPMDLEGAPANLAASAVGPSVIIPIRNNTIALGPDQRIVLIEFEGPQTRQIVITKLYN